MRSLTEQIYVDDIESAEEGIAEILLGNEALNPSAKPGTSLLRPPTSTGHRYHICLDFGLSSYMTYDSKMQLIS